jgi:cellulose synthase/poly-beta-1,6-N-acetylglucosamine synthase-like glycosyltransferase
MTVLSTGKSTSNAPTMDGIYSRVLSASQQRIQLLLVLLWVLGTLAFWRWLLQPSVWVSVPGTLINVLLLFYVTGIPAWPLYLSLRMRQVRKELPVPAELRVAMVVTKAPSEPWPLVQQTLLAMLAQDPKHDTWLADEQPTEVVRHWCEQHGVQISSRAGVEAYHRSFWPRRTRCKEGNLAYFYDHFGYINYDVVVQLDADHIPQPGYLIAMLQPFNDPSVGYVAAPSICNLNAHRSWVARGRLFAEAILHGPMQLGLNDRWAPLCFGSHYAVRTRALQAAGGLGPELAEDHSTTLLLNAQGWRGAFAHRAICHGLGPETFEDAMVQEFQWSRSLTTILLQHLPPLLKKLPWHLRLQFLYSEAVYPLRGSLSLLGFGLPLLALLLDHPWMRVHYPTFLVFSILQIGLTLMPLLHLQQCGLTQPANTPQISWERCLFEVSRGPWVLSGVLKAIEHWLWPRPVTFRVTQKHVASTPLPLSFLLPYLLAAGFGVTAALAFADSTQLANGYVMLTMVTTALFAVTALAVALLSHRQGNHALHLHLPQMGLASCAVLVTFGCWAWRWHDLTAPLQINPADPFSFL